MLSGNDKQQNNKRYANSKGKKGSTQPFSQNKGVPHSGALSDQHANIISEGALSQLINSHINEGDTPATAIVTQNQTATSGQNDSLETGNLAFWTRKQNEYKANLMNQNNQQVQSEMQSVLSNQARIVTHLMSLDECDISVPGGDTNLQGQALGGATNPRSPQS